MKILGVIPARGGSKGIPRKNLVPLLGKPLLAYTAQAALAATSLDRIILSTDDEEIAAVGRSLGLDVPFMRPRDLARDDTPTIEVVLHAWNLVARDDYDAVCLLQPTSPLRTAAVIDHACEKFIASGADTLISVLPIPHRYHPDWALVDANDGWLRWASGAADPPPRRQELHPAYFREGSIYLVKSEVLVRRRSLYGPKIAPFVVSPDDSVNVDTHADLKAAQERLQRRLSVSR